MRDHVLDGLHAVLLGDLNKTVVLLRPLSRHPTHLIDELGDVGVGGANPQAADGALERVVRRADQVRLLLIGLVVLNPKFLVLLTRNPDRSLPQTNLGGTNNNSVSSGGDEAIDVRAKVNLQRIR